VHILEHLGKEGKRMEEIQNESQAATPKPVVSKPAAPKKAIAKKSLSGQTVPRTPTISKDPSVEFLHKSVAYLFPPGTKVFGRSNSFYAEIRGKKVSDVSQYIVDRESLKSSTKSIIGFPVTGEGSGLIIMYQAMMDFLKKKKGMTVKDFEYATSKDLSLSIFPYAQDWDSPTAVYIRDVEKKLVYLKNIATRPVIHLRDEEEILPLEMVKRVNSKTISHLAIHSKLWENIINDDVRPRKLSTRIYEDDYGIYENLVFKDLIDKISLLLQKRIRLLSDLVHVLYEITKKGVAEEVLHAAYFLGYGKLYVGIFETKNIIGIKKALIDAKKLHGEFNGLKRYGVYVKNANARPIAGDVKLTNILAMHKDYKHIYKLMYQYKDLFMGGSREANIALQEESQDAYEIFCQLLTVFSVNHFNMKRAATAAVYSRRKAGGVFKFKDWELTIKANNNALLGINTIDFIVKNKKNKLKFLLIPQSYYIESARGEKYEHIVERLYNTKQVYDKYVFFEPHEYRSAAELTYGKRLDINGDDVFYSVLPISITEVNSFRRIQKLLFECLVRTCLDNDYCGFCGSGKREKTDFKYFCDKCLMTILIMECEQCANQFYATYLDAKPKKNRKIEEDQEHAKEGYVEDVPEFFKQEKHYSFLNIVEMRRNMAVCPYCDQENKVPV